MYPPFSPNYKQTDHPAVQYGESVNSPSTKKSDVPACYQLGQSLWKEGRREQTMAQWEFQDAAEQGYVPARCRVLLIKMSDAGCDLDRRSVLMEELSSAQNSCLESNFIVACQEVFLSEKSFSIEPHQRLVELVEQGYPAAQYIFGFFLYGEGKKTEGREYIKKAADQGYAPALYFLAQEALEAGDEVTWLLNLKLAADGGIPRAQYEYALAEPNPKIKGRYLNWAADNDFGLACYLLGLMESDSNLALEHYKRASKPDFAQALCSYKAGQVLLKLGRWNYAFHSFFRAVRDGHIPSIYQLSIIISEFKDGATRIERSASTIIRSLSMESSSEVLQFWPGNGPAFLHGLVSLQKHGAKIAEPLFKELADGDFVPAQYELAKLLLEDPERREQGQQLMEDAAKTYPLARQYLEFERRWSEFMNFMEVDSNKALLSQVPRDLYSVLGQYKKADIDLESVSEYGFDGGTWKMPLLSKQKWQDLSELFGIAKSKGEPYDYVELLHHLIA
jgi:TPR repeat protein